MESIVGFLPHEIALHQAIRFKFLWAKIVGFRSNATSGCWISGASSVLGGIPKKQLKHLKFALKISTNRSVELRVEDAIPISNSSDIQVEPLSLGGGDWNENTGALSWDLTLGPNETRSLMFGFEVTYPRKKALQGL